MVNHEAQLDRVFSALTNATRRAMLRQLEEHGASSISDLAAPTALSLPGVMKHLDVLERAKLITRAKAGRTMFITLAPDPMATALSWLGRYQRFWSGSLDRLASHAQREELRVRKEKR